MYPSPCLLRLSYSQLSFRVSIANTRNLGFRANSRDRDCPFYHACSPWSAVLFNNVSLIWSTVKCIIYVPHQKIWKIKFLDFWEMSPHLAWLPGVSWLSVLKHGGRWWTWGRKKLPWSDHRSLQKCLEIILTHFYRLLSNDFWLAWPDIQDPENAVRNQTHDLHTQRKMIKC